MLNCCCRPKCGSNWVDYSSVAYSIYFPYTSYFYRVDDQNRLYLGFGTFDREHFESQLKTVYIDGYNFLPNNYVSPSYNDPDCSIGDFNEEFILPQYLVPTGAEIPETDIEAFNAKISQYLSSILECFLKDHSDWGDLSDYSTQSEIIFYVAGVPYRKKVFVCIKDQKFLISRSFSKPTEEFFDFPRIDVYYECKYSIKISIPEEVKNL
jgi:hypothetical protein